MGKITLVTGGAKSGKSSFAEQQLAQSSHQNIVYLATQANASSEDGEMEERIQQHQARRPDTWETIENFQCLSEIIAGKTAYPIYDAYLIDCITIWLTNLFFAELSVYIEKNQRSFDDNDIFIEQMTAEDNLYFSNYLKEESRRLIESMQRSPAEFYVVTNEVGSSIVPVTKLGRLFTNYYGEINQMFAQAADEVYVSIVGITRRWK